MGKIFRNNKDIEAKKEITKLLKPRDVLEVAVPVIPAPEAEAGAQ